MTIEIMDLGINPEPRAGNYAIHRRYKGSDSWVIIRHLETRRHSEQDLI